MKFQIGKTYNTRSVCDSNCVISVTIEKRPDKTVTCKVDGKIKTFRVKPNHNGEEFFKPWGDYSMAPIMTARV